MNKKVIIVFSISFFLGIGYLVYRHSKWGIALKARQIINKIKRKRKKKQLKWEFPPSLIQEAKEELNLLSYEELELVEDYVQSCLKRQGLEKRKAFRVKMKAEGIYEKGELPALEHMLYNLFGISKEYRAGRFKVEPDSYLVNSNH